MHFFTKAQNQNVKRAHSEYVPLNKGKIIGQKPPLQARQVWAIRTRLQLAKKVRDLAMSNLAIDSKLRACDAVALKVEDVAPNGYAVERATIRQMKTRPAGDVRNHWANAPSHRRQSAVQGQEPGGLPVHRTKGTASRSTDPAIRAPGIRLDFEHRSRRFEIWHPFAEANQGHVYPLTNGEPASGTDSARSYEDRNHGQVSGRRGRRCPRHFRIGRRLIPGDTVDKPLLIGF